MQRVTSIGVLSLGKVMGGAGLFLGLIFGVIYGVVFFLVGAAGMAQDGGEQAAIPLFMGIGFCLGAPILYGVFGFVFGLLYAVILNFVFRYTGGLELEIQSD